MNYEVKIYCENCDKTTTMIVPKGTSLIEDTSIGKVYYPRLVKGGEPEREYVVCPHCEENKSIRKVKI